MTMPNFLVVGAGKSGTTALYHYLEQHPQVYVTPVKETNFFALEGEMAAFHGPGVQDRINSWSVTDIRDYRVLFDGASGEKAIGEVCPLYLYSQKAPERIKHHVPEARLVAVLRNPTERAYSAFTHMVREGREPCADFARALEEEAARIEDNWPWIWHYKRVGFYHEQLKRYFELFDRGQIRLYLYEEFSDDPVGVMTDVFGFLGIDTGFVPSVSVKHNVSGIPKSKVLHSFLARRNRLKDIIKPLIPIGPRKRVVARLKNRNLHPSAPLSSEVRQQLIETYRKDVLRLQDLIERDLSGWLEY